MIYFTLFSILYILVYLGLRFGQPRKKAPTAPTGPIIVVDGSNVMHWGDGVPSARVLGLVLRALETQGFVPLVFFDANVGYKLAGRHMGTKDLSRLLSYPATHIAIVPGGTPADPYLIEEAMAQGVRVVSNDRFMDWRASYPALRRKGFLVKGSVSGQKVDLRL